MTTQSFSAPLVKWGRVLGVEVPTDVSVAFGIGGHVPVAGRVNDASFQGTLVPVGGARHRLLLNAAVRERAGIDIGDVIEISIAPDPSNRVPPIPDDFAAALDAVDTARDRFEQWPPSHRREILIWIADAVKAETRARRIARALARVMDG